MIPFYFFRRKTASPMASLYHSGLLDKVDYWGKIDRLALIDEMRHYSKLYALDWGLTCGLCVCFMEGLMLLLRVLTGTYYHPDYISIVCDVAIVMLCTLMGCMHILGQFQEALDYVGGPDD